MQSGRARHLGQMSRNRRRGMLERAGEAREELETQESQAPQEELVALRRQGLGRVKPVRTLYAAQGRFAGHRESSARRPKMKV